MEVIFNIRIKRIGVLLLLVGSVSPFPVPGRIRRLFFIRKLPVIWKGISCLFGRNMLSTRPVAFTGNWLMTVLLWRVLIRVAC